MYSDDPWSQRVILASQSYVIHDDSAANDFVELFGPLIDDNSSNQCPGFCVPCADDQPLWWIVLRWLKVMLLKLARSYHAKPLLLVIAPLIFGMIVGFFLGTQKSWIFQRRKFWSTSLFSTLSLNLRDIVALTCFRLSALMESGMKDDSYHSQTYQHRKDQSVMNGTVSVEKEKEEYVRTNLKSDVGTTRESGVDVSKVPRHVAVIMDGNRRYGKSKYGDVSRGHWDGSSKLVEFAKWCIAEKISVLTVYAFSTENWNRDPGEVASLMAIFSKYCEELRIEALQRNIRILVLTTDSTRVSRKKIEITKQGSFRSLTIVLSFHRYQPM